MPSASDPPASEPLTASASQIRGSSLILGANVITTALDFGSQIAVVRYLSRGDYGAFAYALALTVLLQGICRFGLPDAVSRVLPPARAQREYGKVLGTVILAVSFVVAAGALLVLGFQLLAPVLRHHVIDAYSLRLTVILVLIVPLEALSSVLTGIFASLGKARAIAVRSFVAPLLRFAGVIILILFHKDVYFLTRAYVLASLVGAGVYLWLGIRLLGVLGLSSADARASVRWPARELFTFASTVLVSALLWVLLDTSDTILLGMFKGTDAVGLLRAVAPLARVNQIIIGSFSVLFVPLASTYLAQKNRAGVQQIYVRTATWLTLLCFPVFTMTVAFAPQLVATLFGNRYAGSVPVLWLLSIGYFVQAMTGFNGLTIRLFNHLKYAIAIDMLACLLNVAINLVCIPRWGAVGAAIGTSSVLILHNSLKQFGMHRLTGITAYDRHYLRTLGASLGLVASGALLNHEFDMGIWGALTFTVAAMAVLIFIGRPALQIGEMFPELLRFPLLARFLDRPAQSLG